MEPERKVNAKRTIRKILFVAMWLAIGSGMLTLLIAAMGKQKKELCRDYEIAIKSAGTTAVFLDEEAIAGLLKAASHGKIRGQSKSVFNLQQLEELLEANVWIKNAQLYFDNQSVLHIAVEEREPVVRVFTAGGSSFYMDKTGLSLPLSDSTIAKVPVFTGFPDKKMRTKQDSVLLEDVLTIAQYINHHPFWTAQVAQVDIVMDCGPGCWGFEMIPVAGRHLVRLGDGKNIPRKFLRLLAFYQQVLARTGLDHYKTIDVRFAGQVIGVKNGSAANDSVQAQNRIAELMEQASEDPGDAMATPDTIDNQPAGPKPVQAGNGQGRTPRAVMPQRR